MLRVLVLISAVWMVGCTTSGGRSSQWAALDDAASVSCDKWPMAEDHLTVRDIHALPGKTTGLVADITMRNGQNAFYFARHEGELSASDLKARDFGRGASVAGGGVIKGRLFAAIFRKTRKSNELEIRSLNDNVVRLRARLPKGELEEPKAYFASKGVWVSFSKGGERHVAFARIGKAKQLKLVSFARRFPEEARLVLGEKRTFVVWGAKARNKKDMFFMASVDADNPKDVKPIEIKLPLSSAAESWSVVGYRRGVLLGVVDGDSFVGQANLRIAQVSWEIDYVKVDWVKTRSLLGEHVSEGQWVLRGNKAHLLLPKWVDQEATIAAFRVGASGIENGRALGVLPKGSRIMATFSPQKGSTMAVLRSRKKYGFLFQICDLENL